MLPLIDPVEPSFAHSSSPVCSWLAAMPQFLPLGSHGHLPCISVSSYLLELQPDLGPPQSSMTPSCVCVCVLVAQSCPTLCSPMDCSPPGSSVHGILQVRILEWVAIPFSRGSSQPRDRTWVSCIAGGFFTP